MGRWGRSVAEYEFSVIYEGPALDNHRMPVGDVVESLVGLSALLRETGRVVNPELPDVGVDVRATTAGSWELVVVAVQDLDDAWSAARAWLNGPDSNALVQLVELVGGMGGLLAFLKVRRRASASEVQPDGRTEVTLTDGTKFTVPAEVFSALGVEQVRAAAARFVGPIRREGVERARFVASDRRLSAVTAEEAGEIFESALTPLSTTSHVGDEQLVATVVTPALDGSYIWRLASEDLGTFTAHMDDLDFDERVKRNEVRFGHGDRLSVQVRASWTEVDGIVRGHVDRTILKVRAHYPAYSDRTLNGSDDPA